MTRNNSFQSRLGVVYFGRSCIYLQFYCLTTPFTILPGDNTFLFPASLSFHLHAPPEKNKQYRLNIAKCIGLTPWSASFLMPNLFNKIIFDLPDDGCESHTFFFLLSPSLLFATPKDDAIIILSSRKHSVHWQNFIIQKENGQNRSFIEGK